MVFLLSFFFLLFFLGGGGKSSKDRPLPPSLNSPAPDPTFSHRHNYVVKYNIGRLAIIIICAALP